MIFSELMENIQHERNLSDDELAEEIGITAPSLRNILNRKVVKPDGPTSKKILDYCRKYNIDTEELDWNEIIYEHFQNSPKYQEYQWEDDIDEEGFIKIKHKNCGKSTLVPISAFDGNSTLCIHCWIDKYISRNEYDYNEYDVENYYEFLHVSCGYKYRVSYEQIKQKKFRCPQCFSHSKNANMPAVLGKNNYGFINNPDSPETINEVLIDNLGVSFRVTNCLKRAGIKSVYDLLNRVKSIDDLRPIRNLTPTFIIELLVKLDKKGYRLADCDKEKYQNIEEYIVEHFQCRDCGGRLDGAAEDIKFRLCPACVARRHRIEIPRKINIKVKNTEYSMYSGNEKGFTLFINLHPDNIQEPIKIKLEECSIIANGRQYISNYNYAGYAFSEGYLIPDTVKTFAKVWITDSWANKELEDGDDYLTISIKDETNNKIYYYKFQCVWGGSWRLYDYYELD